MAGTRIHRLPPPIRCRVRGEQLYFGVDRLTLVLPVAVDRKSIAHARLRYRVLRRRHDAQTARDQVLAMHVTRWLAELLSDALAVPA